MAVCTFKQRLNLFDTKKLGMNPCFRNTSMHVLEISVKMPFSQKEYSFHSFFGILERELFWYENFSQKECSFHIPIYIVERVLFWSQKECGLSHVMMIFFCCPFLQILFIRTSKRSPISIYNFIICLNGTKEIVISMTK